MTTEAHAPPAAAGWMTRRRLARFGAFCGVLLIVFTAAFDAIFETTGIPDNSFTPEQIAQYWKDNGQQLLVAHVLFNFASISFFFFAAVLWAVLREAEGEPAWLSAATVWGAIVAITAATMGNAYWGIGANFGHDFPELTTPLLGELMFHLAVVFFMAWLGFVVLQLGVSLLIFQTGVFPRWIAWVGLFDCVLWLIQQWPVPRHDNMLQEILFDRTGPGAHLVQFVWLIAVTVILLRRTGKGMVPAAPAVPVSSSRS